MEPSSPTPAHDGAAADARSAPGIGQVVAGRFVLREPLSQRPGRQTYLADDGPDRVVAKGIGESALAGGALMRLEYEANQLGTVDSPWFAPVLFAGREEGVFWLVSRYAEGRPLAARLRCGSLSVAETLTV